MMEPIRLLSENELALPEAFQPALAVRLRLKPMKRHDLRNGKRLYLSLRRLHLDCRAFDRTRTRRDPQDLLTMVPRIRLHRPKRRRCLPSRREIHSPADDRARLRPGVWQARVYG